MNRFRHPVRFAALVTGVTLGVFACADREGFGRRDPLFEVPESGVPEASPPPVCGIHCSRDLKQVLDGCEGAETVLATCNADQGCGGDKCVDACTAAAMSKGSAGCDFWTVYPAGVSDSNGSCFAAMIANTWDRAVTLGAEHGSSALDISKSTYLVGRNGDDPTYSILEGALPPGQIAVVFLSHDESSTSEFSIRCPFGVTPALRSDPMRYTSGRVKGFRIKADAPVSAYSIAPYGGFTSFEPTATLLLPTTSWTQHYITVSPAHFEQVDTPRTLQIIAAEDDTAVNIRPTARIVPVVGVEGSEPGAVRTWTLARGEVLQFVQTSLAGSPIEATKPIGVFGGAQCSDLPGPSPYCDMLQQQIPPFENWGTEYAVVPFKPRVASLSGDAVEQVPYTIVGAVDGTQLIYEPARPRGAPETLAANQSVSFITDQLFVVKSQDTKHPFHVNVYMTSSDYGGGTIKNVLAGDPDFVNVPPVDQYLDRYVFLTDFTYPDTALTIVRKKTPNGFMPVELECAGELGGFVPLGSSGMYEYAWVQLTSGFLAQKFAKGECNYGRQEARSNGPFAVTVWGTGPYASYGFVGGVGLRPIHEAPPPLVK
jgi:hypothetical protein